ncbi:MAG: hypothetical protein LBT79_03635, partial [Elusimicrobiota bacterium]|nr:hypothetical protein [Elusimicrobiota bacterium]
MANSKVLYIKAMLESASLATMQRKLNTVFARVAKTFDGSLGKIGKSFARTAGSGLKMLAGGSLFGLGMKVVNGLTTAYDKGSAEMDRILKKADDLQTIASAFGADAFDTLSLLQAGERKGLSQDDMQKFLITMTELMEKEEKEKGSTGLQEGHMTGSAVEAFEKTIRGLQDMYQQGSKLRAEGKESEGIKLQQKVVAKFAEIFGAKLSGRALEFLEGNIDELLAQTPAAKSGRKAVNERTNELEQLQDKQTKGRIQDEHNQMMDANVNEKNVDKQREVENQERKTILKSLELFDTAAAIKVKSIEAERLTLETTD